MSVYFLNLYRFTQMEVKSARADARAGRKDSARNVLRFIRNASVIEILKAADLSCFPNVDVPLLNWELSQLETECHPSSSCDQTSDIAAIRAMLEPIAHFVSKHTGGLK